MSGGELLRPADVQAEYGLNVETLKSWRKSWRDGGAKVGPAWFSPSPRTIAYRRSVVEAWIADREATTGSAVAS